MVADKTTEWKIGGTRARPTLSLEGAACDLALRGRQIILHLPCGKPAATNEAASGKSTIIADATANGMVGSQQGVSGILPWKASRIGAFAEPVPKPKIDETTPTWGNQYPAGAFGITSPNAETVLIKNATLWTLNGNDAPTRADLLVQGGKIAAIGANLSAPANTNATTIDAAGKHVTPGLIDAHSHTAVVGNVNEPTSSITAEVRIGDVIDATDINIYRQLAGGVTAANVMHGSANTIGGQNQIIKMRWGSDADGLKFSGAMPGIKFALGENVKQSGWDGVERGISARYPQTRMGVEQILRDGFQAAQHYRKQWDAYRANAKTNIEPRRDLQLDTLLEILDKKRIVHIHSYRADEILMFVRLAQEFGFTVGTFQHVLEGYKVADAIASIGAGGSTFSDWWAYKMEVYDAIPYNAALMHRAGVLTTLNSDSNELARRLNTEAAKVVRYGNISETEALKMVSQNAAKQLRIDNRVGTLAVGMDADFVIWNTHPLSTAALAEQTWIEGRKYFDRATDQRLRTDAARERERLIARALPQRLARLSAPPAGGATANNAASRPANPNANAITGDVAVNVREVLEYMAMQRWLHDAKQFRHSYWDGGSWHECTEDAK